MKILIADIKYCMFPAVEVEIMCFQWFSLVSALRQKKEENVARYCDSTVFEFWVQLALMKAICLILFLCFFTGPSI